MTLRVAIVGMGGIGNNHARCYSQHPEAGARRCLRYHPGALRQCG